MFSELRGETRLFSNTSHRFCVARPMKADESVVTNGRAARAIRSLDAFPDSLGERLTQVTS